MVTSISSQIDSIKGVDVKYVGDVLKLIEVRTMIAELNNNVPNITNNDELYGIQVMCTVLSEFIESLEEELDGLSDSVNVAITLKSME